jgi:NADPH:quinone reductase-like Zn-dependent oxidoreductase
VRAIVRDVYGSPDVLRLEDVPVPEVGERDVLVRVRASSINDFDWLLLGGTPFINRVGAPFRPKQHILGSDVAGVVESVGAAVTSFRAGDEVYGDLSPSGFGAYAEYVSAPEASLARKPEALTFEQAAALPQAGGLAVVGLRGRREIRPGDKVLVNGAGGGVGTLAVQIAKAFGAEVTGVDAAHKLDAVRGAGADHVADYATHDITRSGAAFDRILDMACHHSISAYRRILAPDGYCGLIGGSIPRILFTMVGGPASSLFNDRKVGVPFWKPNDPTGVALLGRLVESGQLSPVIDSVHPLEELPAALRRFGAQQHTGKIVITV